MNGCKWRDEGLRDLGATTAKGNNFNMKSINLEETGWNSYCSPDTQIRQPLGPKNIF